MEKGRGKGTDTLQTDNVFTRKKYIDREAICYQLEKQESIDGQPRAIRRARRIVADFPAADVVPVVRCRDCKHRDPEDRKCDCGGLKHAHMFPVADDWFCADGERKDGDGDV